MPFVGSDFPARTRKGSSKYAKELNLMVKNPNKVYEFDQDFDAPASVAAGLRTNKLVKELSLTHKGTFEFASGEGNLYGKFIPNSRRSKKSKKSSK